MPSRCLLALRLRLEREALSLILRRDCLVSQVDQASSPEGLFAALRTAGPELVLLDRDLVEPDDPTLESVRRRPNAPRFLVLSASEAPEQALPWLAVQVDGYLPKSADLENLQRAVRTVRLGRRYIHPPIMEALLQYVTPTGIQLPSLDRLSRREREVFDRIARGDGSNQIAQELGLSVTTASTYRARMLQKLGLRNNAQVAQFALRHAGGHRHDGDSRDTDPGVPDAEPST